MGLKTYLLNRIDSRKFRLNGILPSTRLPNKQKLCQAFRDHVLYSPAQLPPKVDLRDDMTPVEDQSKIGSCVANCLAGAYEYLTKKSDGRNTDVSRLFIYYNGRAKEGPARSLTDSGCTMTGAIEALEEFGTCLESIWPYDISDVNSRPSDKAFQEAKNHKITEALQVEIDLNEMKSCIAQGFPFAFGLRLFKSFDKASTTGVVPLPNVSDRARSSHGSHALLAVGYSDHSKSFIVRNSWGADWGENGYCYIPYDYMTNPDLCFDAWAVRKLANDTFGKEHWDNADAINYLRNVALELMSANNNSNGNNDDSCAIENIVEDDEPSSSSSSSSGGHGFATGYQSDPWSHNPAWGRYDSTGNNGRSPWHPHPDNTHPRNDTPVHYNQNQQYDARGSFYYDQQHQQGIGGDAYNPYNNGFQPAPNFGGHFQNQQQNQFQPSAPSYQSDPNNFSQFSAYGINQSYAYPTTLADIMNSSADANQQHGTGFNYNNPSGNHPNQYRQ